MKKFIFLLAISFCWMNNWAQNSASAVVNSRATIIDPIKIDKTVDLDFGNIISAYNPGQVVLSPDGSRVAYGVQISNSVPGTVTPAEAVVTHGNNNYSISLPQQFTLYNQENPNQILIIDRFTVQPQEGNLIDIIKIGGTLNLDANQTSGFYTNSSGFNVTVSYN
ncbi:DUF4402 domain-containing protein [Christiangramia sabulilitoris]|uniref:DUF4402 domain-containing protein n=1 Tax=Christiangramia sabulilitoris TaxID=2583991 RepID=A0A550I6A7_9FLAO|nr:DUF4402 domain-containing protein [Christiangramia sabulilitoris]TRO66512.1 DUF4402 domain-containing protein [Christiangramia sabulilitoris]